MTGYVARHPGTRQAWARPPGMGRARHGSHRPHPRRDRHPPGLPRPALHTAQRVPPVI